MSQADEPRRCLVTGAAGFVGSVLARTLVERGHRVLGVDRRPAPRWRAHADVDHVLLDLRDPVATAGLVEAFHPHVVFHLAAQAFVPLSVERPYETVMDNVGATASVLEACRTFGVRDVVLASSGAVYGAEAGERIYRETEPTRAAANLYGPSKIAAEAVAGGYALTFGIRVHICRFMNTYGPGDDSESRIVPVAVRRALRGEPYDFGERDDGSTALDFVYVDDVVAGYVAAAENGTGQPDAGQRDAAQLCRVFNFGTGQPVSLEDLVARVSRLVDGRDRIAVFRGPPAPEPRRKSLDCGRAGAVLGWRARTGLTAGLAATVEWHRRIMEEAGEIEERCDG